MGRLEDLPIRSKLVVLLAAPTAVLVCLGLVGVGSGTLRALTIQRVAQSAGITVHLTALAHELQVERALAAARTASGGREGTDALIAQQAVVDEHVATLDRELEARRTSGGYAAARDAVDAANLERLPEVRDIAGAARETLDTVDLYTPSIQALLSGTVDVAAGSGDDTLVRHAAAAVALSHAKEDAALQQVIVSAAARPGRLSAEQLRRLVALSGTEATWIDQFRVFAAPRQLGRYHETVAGELVGDVVRLRQDAVAGGTGRLTVPPEEWVEASTDKLDRLRQVEVQVAAQVGEAGRALSGTATRQVVAGSAALLAVLLVTIGVSLWLARSMTRSLGLLTRSATEVADRQLPEMVERMRRAEPLDADAELVPARATTKDEIGQVAAAFNTVQETAVRIAAEQAAVRRSVSDIVLNLARRSQSLIDRLLEGISDLERGEADPHTRGKLSYLDHLATLMRRTAENLIVFSGSDQPTPRQTSHVVLLPDILDAVQAEVEDVRRVQVVAADSVAVAGRVASGLTHLLAELIDNATTFSPPDTVVSVAGQRLGRGYVIEVEDQGIGMSAEELEAVNRRLDSPPVWGFSTGQRLGLHVVGRLAQRFGIKVQLRHSAYGGLAALVLLPAGLVDPEPPASRALPATIAPHGAPHGLPHTPGSSWDEDTWPR